MIVLYFNARFFAEVVETEERATEAKTDYKHDNSDHFCNALSGEEWLHPQRLGEGEQLSSICV
jgi:hypothetical protein